MIDHKFYSALRASIEAAFKQVASEHGLKSLDLGRIGVDAMGGFRATVQGVTGDGLSPEESSYNTSRRFSDYQLPALGETVTIRGQRWTVTGRKTRGNCRVTAIKVPGGGRYLLPMESFERNFPLKKEAATS